LISQGIFAFAKDFTKTFCIGIALAKGIAAPDGYFRRTKINYEKN
jgi:hypothetical protein